MGNENRAVQGWGRAPRMLAVAVLCALVATLAGCSRGASEPELPAPDPTRASRALDAGLQAQTQGKLDDAAEHYRESLRYDQRNKFAMYNLALVDAARNDFGQAEEKYRAVLGLDPRYAPALFNLAILRKAKGDTAEAVTLYRRVLEVTPDDAAAHLNLGLLLRATGETAAGDREVKRATTLNPELRDPAAAKG